MASLPGIIIKVGAETRDAVQGLNRVDKAMGRTMSRGQKLNATMRRMGPAIGAAAAAAATAAVAFGLDAAQAFIEDQKQADILAKQLGKLGFEDATKQVEDWTTALQNSANVADTDIRQAFSTILRGTKNVEEAQRATELAFDMAAYTGKDAQTVAEALTGAYQGNTKGLKGLKTGLDKAVIASGNMRDITDGLTKIMGGGSEAQAGTLSGAISGVQIQWDELKESFGRGLMTGGSGNSIADLEEAEARLRDMGDAAETAGSLTNKGLGFVASGINRFTQAVDEAAQGDVLGFAQAVESVMTLGVSENLGWGSNLAGEADKVTSAFDAARVAVKRWAAAMGTYTPATSSNTVDGWEAQLLAVYPSDKGQRRPNRIGIENDRRRRQQAKAAARRAAVAASRERAKQERRAKARTGTAYNQPHGVIPW